MSTGLQTRPPTGDVPAPNILIAGEEKSGKTHLAFSLSSSGRVGTTYVIDIGEGCADQYAALGPYQVVVHDGTLEGLAAVAKAIAALPVDPDRPDVVVFDSVSALWTLAKDWAENTARARMAKKNQSGEPNITMDLWNGANHRFYAALHPLLDWPGIVVLTARARWAAKVEGGKPVPGEQVWSVEAQKNLGYEVDVVLRATQPRQLEIEGGRTLLMNLPADKRLNISGVSLDELIFDKLGVKAAGKRNTVRPDTRIERSAAGRELLAALIEKGGRAADGEGRQATLTEARALYASKADGDTITRAALDELVSAITPAEAPAAAPTPAGNIARDEALRQVTEVCGGNAGFAEGCWGSRRDSVSPEGLATLLVDARKGYADHVAQLEANGTELLGEIFEQHDAIQEYLGSEDANTTQPAGITDQQHVELEDLIDRVGWQGPKSEQWLLDGYGTTAIAELSASRAEDAIGELRQRLEGNKS